MVQLFLFYILFFFFLKHDLIYFTMDKRKKLCMFVILTDYDKIIDCVGCSLTMALRLYHVTSVVPDLPESAYETHTNKYKYAYIHDN